MGLGDQKEKMTSENWEPDNGICLDHERRLVSPVIPKSACTTLRRNVFLLDMSDDADPKNNLVRGEFSKHDTIHMPDDYDCIVFIRDPLDRLISGIAEVLLRQLGHEGLHSSEQMLNFHNADKIEEYIWNFVNHNGTKHLQGFIDYFTKNNRVNDHIEKQTILMDWQGMQNKFSNITLFEVDGNLWPNIIHWMKIRRTPIIKDSEYPYMYCNSVFTSGFKSYIKGIYTLAFRDNRNNLLDDYKEYYKTDIDFYNSHKAEFYRGGEQ